MKQVRAPGKLVLVGEYAVLDGAPAIVCAVDAGVECLVDERAEQLEIETPTEDDTFAASALAAVLAAPARYVFRNYGLPELDGKLGIGGSAAATVAGCLAGFEGTPETDTLHTIAATVHHAVQGSGSGIDVAASVHGGVLRFEDGTATPVQTVTPVVIWSGESASTGPRVEQYLAWEDREAFVASSRALVERFENDPVDTLRAARTLLASMSRATGIHWMTASLEAICDLAESHGGGAKPSGAGGGDCAVALFSSDEQKAAFVQECEAQGYLVVPLAVSRGAHLV